LVAENVVLGIFLLILLTQVATAGTYSAVAYKWNAVEPSVTENQGVSYVGNCVDERLLHDNNKWCSFGFFSHFDAVFSWDLSLGSSGTHEATNVKVGCSGLTEEEQVRVSAWNYESEEWTELGLCGVDGEAYYDIPGGYVDGNERQVKLRASGGGGGTTRMAELFVDSVNYTYNTLPVVSNLTISPEPAHSHSDLEASWVFSDEDGDPENSIYRWLVNSVEYGTESALGSGNFVIGDSVVFDYTPCDDTHCSSPQNVEVAISSYPPTVLNSTDVVGVKGNVTQVWSFDVEDLDEGQTMEFECALDDSPVCSDLRESSGLMQFSCEARTPYDEAIHELRCTFNDGFVETEFVDEFETDMTPPSTGNLIIENAGGFTVERRPRMLVSSDGAAYMRFACSEGSLEDAGWAGYSESYAGFDLRTGNGCSGSDGLKVVWVEFMDETGNVQNQEHASDSVILDTTPPGTYDSHDGNEHDVGYDVTITEQDGLDSDPETFYCVDSSDASCEPGIEVTGSATVRFGEYGVFYLRYVSTDAAGNSCERSTEVELVSLPSAPPQPPSGGGGGGGGSSSGGGSSGGSPSGGGGTSAKIEIPEIVITYSGIELEPRAVEDDIAFYGVDASVDASVDARKNVVITRTFKYEIDTDSLEVSKTVITELVETGGNMTGLAYIARIPGYFAKDPDEVEVSAGAGKVEEKDGYIFVTFDCVGAGSGFGVSYSVKDEKLLYRMIDVITEMEKPVILAAAPEEPEIVIPVPEPEPETAVVEEETVVEEESEKEQAETTGLLALVDLTKDNASWIVLAVLTVLIAAFSAMRISAIIPNEGTDDVIKELQSNYEWFPEGEFERGQIVKRVAEHLQKKDGSFHAARIYRVLENAYGEEVAVKRIDVEKWIGSWLRERAELGRTEGRKKIYHFRN
jgi:hypothetical protein